MMKSFLEHVAEDLLRKHGTDLSQLTVVFPNKRASLFLNAHLARLSDRPIWSPRYITISELFRQLGNRTVADPIKLVCELHRSFTSITGFDETLDRFYGWGQMLLSDFDDLDKNLAEADHVLANLRDVHEMDSIDYLNDEQKEALRKFFSTFSTEHTTLLHDRFLRLWSHMADIYHDFNDRLAQQGLAYEGALYREIAERVGGQRSTVNVQRSMVNGHYIFVGFNVLQPVEQRLFTWLKHEGRAFFYWDFDDYYLQGEAGMFITQNLLLFPNELDRKDETIYNCFAQPKDITVASAPTETIQARYAPMWLNSLSPKVFSPTSEVNAPDTAIVLCDEKLLPTVIHCLPDGVDHVNVTTGFPLSQAPVASLITTLFALRTQGYQPSRDRYRLRQVNALLRHPYVADLSPQVADLHRELNEKKIYYPTPSQLCTDEVTTIFFRPLVGDDSKSCSPNSNAPLLKWMLDVLKVVAPKLSNDQTPNPPNDQTPTPPNDQPFSIHSESIFRAYTLLNRLLSLVDSGDLQVDTITLQRLSAQLKQTTTIPFHGEPAQGLQVMGLLETRCLDFRHVLLLSANEGNIPKGVSDTSFIPYTIRKAYGLTTPDHKVAIYSYYFHRLLQRADDVTIIYNNSTSDGHTGEMSRFVLQLMVEDQHHHIATRSLQAPQTFIPFRPQQVAKTPEMMQKLLSRFNGQWSTVNGQWSTVNGQWSTVNGQWSTVNGQCLTPSAINRYFRCPLQFYYTYVHDLRESDDNDDDTIDNRIFGNIFHEAARIIYSRLMEKSSQILASDLKQLLDSGIDIELAVDQAIRQELFHLDAEANTSPLYSSPALGDTSRLRSPTAATPDLSGLQLINREVIIHYLRQLLTIDLRLAPFTIIGLETDVTMPLTTQHVTIVIGGRIDRLDRIVKDGQEQIRVIDYKTGSRVPTPLSGVEAIFNQEQLKNHSDYYLQAFLYSIIVEGQRSTVNGQWSTVNGQWSTVNGQCSTVNGQCSTVSPALLFIQHAGADDYNPILKFGKEHINDVAPYAGQFMSLLTQVIDEIFDPAAPFIPTHDRARCTNCPFRQLCH